MRTKTRKYKRKYNMTGWSLGMLALTVSGLLVSGIASAANITITDDDINGVVITPDTNFDITVPTVTGNGTEDASLTGGQWISNHGTTGSGIVFLVEPGTTILSDILDATWSSTNTGVGNTSVATIDFRFESDVNGTLLSGRTIPQTWLTNGWFFEETGSLQGINGHFRDPTTGDHVTLPANLTIFASSDVEVPEPSTLALFSMGFAGLGFARRRKNA